MAEFSFVGAAIPNSGVEGSLLCPPATQDGSFCPLDTRLLAKLLEASAQHDEVISWVLVRCFAFKARCCTLIISTAGPPHPQVTHPWFSQPEIETYSGKQFQKIPKSKVKFTTG